MESLAAYVATGVVSLTVGVLLSYFQPKAKVVYWSPHFFLFKLTNPNVVLQTDALTVQNIGRRTAERVELVMNERPDFFQFSPAVPHNEEVGIDGNFVLRIATLGPNEYFTLQLLSYTKVPQLLNIRSSAGQAKPMPFQIQRVYSKWVYALIAICMITGFGFSLYWLIRAILFLSGEIGIG